MRNLSKRLPIRGRGYSLASKACGPLACRMYVLICESTKDAAVVDPSFYSPFEFQALVDHLELQKANLKHVLLTHGHPDHVVGVAETMKAWPEASLHLHPLEEENYLEAREIGFDFGIRFSDEALPPPTHDLKDGDILSIGNSIELSVIHTPGHAPGHVAFVDRRRVNNSCNASGNIGDNQTTGNVLISGDLLFYGSVGRTDFQNSSMDDLYAR
jgi:hydroxyacylglutathione hydrolase